MPTKVTSNGRVTIPKRVRDYLGIEPGTEVAFQPSRLGANESKERFEKKLKKIAKANPKKR